MFLQESWGIMLFHSIAAEKIIDNIASILDYLKFRKNISEWK